MASHFLVATQMSAGSGLFRHRQFDLGLNRLTPASAESPKPAQTPTLGLPQAYPAENPTCRLADEHVHVTYVKNPPTNHW